MPSPRVGEKQHNTQLTNTQCTKGVAVQYSRTWVISREINKSNQKKKREREALGVFEIKFIRPISLKMNQSKTKCELTW